MAKIKAGVIILALLVGSNPAAFCRSYYYSRNKQENPVLSTNAQKSIAVAIVVGGIFWWQKGAILHGARSLRHRSIDREMCYQCELEIPTVMGDCGYGLCRPCFIEYCRQPYCYTDDCTETYCDGCNIAHQQSWAKWHFDWKRSHCPTCYGALMQVEER